MNYKQSPLLLLSIFILSAYPNNHATLTSTPLTNTPPNQALNFIKKHIGFSVHIDNKPRQDSFKKILDGSKEWTTNQFTDYCSHYSDQGLTAYYFYDNPNFYVYLKTLSQYKDHINRLHKEFHHCRKCKKRILKETGFSTKKFKSIICQFHKQLQHEEKLVQRQKRQNKKQLRKKESKQIQKAKISDNQLATLQKLYVQYKQKQMPQIVVNKSLNNRIIEDRKNALADTLTENIPWKEKLYTLNAGAKELLDKHSINKINYEVCYGNEIQQQLHGEYVTILNQTSEIRNATDADVMRLVASMSEVGLSATHNGHIEQATTLANACWTFLDYGKAIAMGAFEGIVLDQVDMVMHPVQTIKNVGSLLSNVGYYFGKAVYEYGHLGYLKFTDPEAAHKKVEAWHENAKKLANALYDQYQNSSGTDLARGTTRLLTGAIFGPKVMGAVIKVVEKIPGKVAEKVAEVVRALQEEERVHVTTEGRIKVKAPQYSLRNKTKNIGGNKSKLKNVSGKAKEAVKRSKTTTKIGKYGKYEDAAYHTKIGNKVKSKAPIDGQHALNNSMKIRKINSTRRIAISHGEFVVLDQTQPGLYHGHVCSWNDLSHNMKTTLRKAKLVTNSGKIRK